jgi:hypothetical protein
MAIIYTYPQISELSNSDTLVISDISKGNKTKSVTVGQLIGGLATTTQVNDTVITGASFNTNNGTLTLTRNSSNIPSVTVDLDGRYALPSSLYTNADVDAHLNKTNQIPDSYVLTLSNNDYAWAAQSGSGGGGSVTSITTTAPITGGTITTTGTIGITQASTSAGGYISSADWNTFNNKQSTSEKGVADGYAPLDGNNKVPAVHLPDSLVGAVVYQGTWNALTNIPTLPTPAAGNNGHYYIVSDPGTYLGITYAVGDWAISNGIAWEKVDNTQDVNSVFGRQGDVVANASDYSAFYDANVQSNWTETNSASDAFILNKPATITQAQADEIAANTTKTSFPGFGTTVGTALEGNTVIPAAYTNADVDAHLNTSAAGNNEVLSWTGSDYEWVVQSGGASGTSTQMAIFDSTSTITSTGAVVVNGSSQIIMDVLRGSDSYADDTAALAGGVPYGGLYRTGSIVKINLLGNPPGPPPETVDICNLIWTTTNSIETELIAGGNIPIITTPEEMYLKFLQNQPAAAYWQYNENESSRGLYYNLYARSVVKPPSGFRLPTYNDYRLIAGFIPQSTCNPNQPNQNTHGAPLPNNFDPAKLTNTDFLGDSGFNAYGYGGALVFSSNTTAWSSDGVAATFWTSQAANLVGSRIDFTCVSSPTLELNSWANSDFELASIRFVKDA